MKEIILFNRALNKTSLSFKEVNSLANAKGYLVHPECLNERVLNFLKTLPINYNSTFYKAWNDVVSKNRDELFLDQILHYMSTYGSDFMDKPYIPNENPELVSYEDYSIILPISISEIENKIQTMFNSGIALKQETIDNCLELIEELSLTINYDNIKNKEVCMYIHKKRNTIPSKPEEMVRYLVYTYTGKTLLIKDKATINAIRNVKLNNIFNNMDLVKLSSVFFRYKPIFLAMKNGNECTINKLRKLANVHHKPYEFTFFEKILSGTVDLSDLEKNLENLNNYKKVVLLQTIKIRNKNTEIKPYIIRNGKIWIGENNKNNNKNYYSLIYSMIYKSLITSLNKKKACSVKLHPSINLTLPTSEKNFIGNLPFGSYINLNNSNSIIGINWKEIDGASDLDFSLIDSNENKIGWNSYYYNKDNSVIYSGDMTSANPEATELLFCKNELPNGVIKINNYCGSPNSKYTLFFAKTDSDYTVEYNKMVNPNDIIFSTQLEMTSNEMLIGIIVNNKFIFNNIRTGNKRVSNGNSITTNYILYSENTNDCYLDLKQVLSDAGFTFVDNNPDLDLSILDKSSLINLLA